ncbi:hypothetical protein ACHAWF_003195 [Thalassiosira exigua]
MSLDRFFPAPSRSQMLHAYPKSVIKKFGHANIFQMLDATEIYPEVASMKTVNTTLYYAYKHHWTLKWLACCCPIGSFHKDSIDVGHGGSISNLFATRVSKILESIPFGMAVEVGKGFLMKNQCALLGIICIRPMKYASNYNKSDLIFHSSFLLQNFKLAFIQGRPSVAEICWYGATDDGSIDVRSEPELWGLDPEFVRWHELCNLEEN